MADPIRPDASGVPILVVFPLIENTSKVVSIDRDHPLLSVEELSDIYLKGDKRRVRIVLTTDDAKAFAKILGKFDGVGITAGHDTAMISGFKGFDGSLTFDNPIAAYLRQRFHVKPGSNEVDRPPVSPLRRRINKKMTASTQPVNFPDLLRQRFLPRVTKRSPFATGLGLFHHHDWLKFCLGKVIQSIRAIEQNVVMPWRVSRSNGGNNQDVDLGNIWVRCHLIRRKDYGWVLPNRRLETKIKDGPLSHALRARIYFRRFLAWDFSRLCAATTDSAAASANMFISAMSSAVSLKYPGGRIGTLERVFRAFFAGFLLSFDFGLKLITFSSYVTSIPFQFRSFPRFALFA